MNRETFTDEVAQAMSSFVPTVSPACANYVSTMLNTKGGQNIGDIIYVPKFFDIYTETKNPEPGDIIVFDQTYDAVDPAGIGPEDDMTHVGIVDKAYGGKLDHFFHYSNSAKQVVWANFRDSYWSQFPHRFLKVPFESAAPMAKNMVKIFYHDGKMAIVKDGHSVPVKSFSMEVEL